MVLDASARISAARTAHTENYPAKERRATTPGELMRELENDGCDTGASGSATTATTTADPAPTTPSEPATSTDPTTPGDPATPSDRTTPWTAGRLDR